MPCLLAQLIATVNNAMGGKAKPLDYMPWLREEPDEKAAEQAHIDIVAVLCEEKHGNS